MNCTKLIVSNSVGLIALSNDAFAVLDSEAVKDFGGQKELNHFNSWQGNRRQTLLNTAFSRSYECYSKGTGKL